MKHLLSFRTYRRLNPATNKIEVQIICVFVKKRGTNHEIKDYMCFIDNDEMLVCCHEWLIENTQTATKEQYTPILDLMCNGQSYTRDRIDIDQNYF